MLHNKYKKQKNKHRQSDQIINDGLTWEQKNSPKNNNPRSKWLVRIRILIKKKKAVYVKRYSAIQCLFKVLQWFYTQYYPYIV